MYSLAGDRPTPAPTIVDASSDCTSTHNSSRSVLSFETGRHFEAKLLLTNMATPTTARPEPVSTVGAIPWQFRELWFMMCLEIDLGDYRYVDLVRLEVRE